MVIQRALRNGLDPWRVAQALGIDPQQAAPLIENAEIRERAPAAEQTSLNTRRRPSGPKSKDSRTPPTLFTAAIVHWRGGTLNGRAGFQPTAGSSTSGSTVTVGATTNPGQAVK